MKKFPFSFHRNLKVAADVRGNFHVCHSKDYFRKLLNFSLPFIKFILHFRAQAAFVADLLRTKLSSSSTALLEAEDVEPGKKQPLTRKEAIQELFLQVRALDVLWQVVPWVCKFVSETETGYHLISV